MTKSGLVFFVAMGLISALVTVAAYAGVVYVAAHFIHKFW